jgi:endonuclease/exonuclease/phosphatase family metal-dependent hydrolase
LTVAELRVATLNIWGRHGDWPRRREVLRTGLAALRPDLIALQETILLDGYDQVPDILGPDLHVVHQDRRSPDGTGCSIAARMPPRAVHQIDLGVTDRVDPTDFVGRATAAEFDTATGPVLFVNHKPNWQLPLERERELQAVRTARAIEDLVAGRRMHVIVVGDFDARPETASLRFWTGRQSLDGTSVQYQDAWERARPGEPGHTFTIENPLINAEADWSRIPPRRIDYVLVRCDERGPTLTIESCERLLDHPVDGVRASDHFGVTAVLAAGPEQA